AHRAKSRFEDRDWHGMQQDSAERLSLYKTVIDKIVPEINDILDEKVQDRSIWAKIKENFTELIEGRDDFEIVETFFNSVTRRIFATVGVDPNIEYVDSEFEHPPTKTDDPIYKTYFRKGSTRELVKEILLDYKFRTPFQDIELDTK